RSTAGAEHPVRDGRPGAGLDSEGRRAPPVVLLRAQGATRRRLASAAGFASGQASVKSAHPVASRRLTDEREKTVHERGDGRDSQGSGETPREAHVLEVSLSGAARVRQKQAIDQSGGHGWRCPVFRKVAFTLYLMLVATGASSAPAIEEDALQA